MRSPEAIVLVEQLLEMDDVRSFLKKHDIWRTRELPIRPDAAQRGYWKIPVLDRRGERWFNLFKPGTNPKKELKDRLQQLARTRPGYRPGDLFKSPIGNFIITDTLGIKEV